MKKLISLFAFLVLVLASCTKEAIYPKAYRFKDEQWAQNVKPKFEVDIQDTTQLYDFIFTLRTTTDYAYNNIWIFRNQGHRRNLIRELCICLVNNEQASRALG